MTSLLGRIFGKVNGKSVHKDASDSAYDLAMQKSDELINKMREESQSTDVARAVTATFWMHRHNVPFLATVYEATQEAGCGTLQRPEDLATG